MYPNPLRMSRLALAVNLAVVSLAAGQSALAQTSSGKSEEKTLGTVHVTADKPVEIEAKDTYQATTSTIGKGKQALRDIPQSVTVVTEKLIDDRNLDTLKDVLHHTAGVTFLAAEGGEEDIRLRGFSLQQTGDIYVDGMRDPGIYERDTFNYDRVEVLRGSASMLFGRGSTGGVVNQVSKQAFLLDQNEIDFTYGTGNYKRIETDLNIVTGESSAFRLTAMKNDAENNGAGASANKEGAAGNFRTGIGERNEYFASLYYLKNRNGINYGLPWLQAVPGDGGRTLIDKDPSAYYGVDSDYANSDIVHGTVGHVHRFDGGGELKTAFRAGQYERDQRASSVRFAAASAQPGGKAVDGTNISDRTVLTRGSNNKAMDLDTQVLQSDYTNKFNWFGFRNEVTSGVDLNHERRNTYAFATPAGVSLTKSNTILGDDDGTSGVDETLRQKLRSNDFDYLTGGAYFQDMLHLTEHWKLLGGLRYDYANGEYRTWGTSGATAGTITSRMGRHDKMPSQRWGLLFQPDSATSFHFSYGTSFNTSGDTYQYDPRGSNTPPEKSRNIEVGSKADFFSGDLSLRTALFYATKYNERNTDTDVLAENPNAYQLSAERYTKGFESDIAGRITPNWETYISYTWIPVAKIKKGADDSTASEPVGQRPGLIPKHQGSLWTTYKIASDWRVGAGVNGRSKMYPQLVSSFQVEGYLTYDAMAEYTVTRDLSLKLNASNLTNKLYADNIYRGHYVPGKGRTFQLTAAYKF